MDAIIEKTLKNLELLINKALAQEEESFPEHFYFVADFFLTSHVFKETINEIEQERYKDHLAFKQLESTINRHIEYVSESIINFIQNNSNVTARALAEVNLLNNCKDNSLCGIMIKFGNIKQFYKLLLQEEYSAFADEMHSHIILLEKRVDDLCNETEKLGRLKNTRLWECLCRFSNIRVLYNPSEYKKIQSAYALQGRDFEAYLLNIQHQGLSRCIYPVKNKLSYDTNFSVKDGKSAITSLWKFVQKKLGGDSSENKKIRFIEDKGTIKVFVGVLEKKPIAKKSLRGKLALFFSKKKECDSDQLAKIIGVESLQEVLRAVNNFNKLFNNYGLKAVIERKNIPSYLKEKKMLTRNPLYWA